MADAIVVRAVAGIDCSVVSLSRICEKARVFVSDQKRHRRKQRTPTWVVCEGTCDSDKASEGEEVRYFEEHGGCDDK